MSAEDVAAAVKEMGSAAPRYAQAQSMYDGTAAEVFFSDKVREILGDSGKKVRINLLSTVVDVVTDRLEFANFRAPDESSEAIVNEVKEGVGLGLLAKEIHSDAGRLGDAYLIALPDDTVPGGVGVFAHGPENVRVFYDPEYPTRKTHAAQTWRVSENEAVYLRVNLYYSDHIEYWQSIEPIESVGTGNRDKSSTLTFRSVDEDGDNEFGVVPVFHFKAGAGQYGTPESQRGYGAQHGLNKALVTLMSSMDSAGFPQRYALQTEENLDSTEFGDPTATAATGADATTASNASAVRRGGPGTTLLLNNVKAVGQFSAADLGQFLETGSTLVKWMASATGTPLDFFEMEGGTPSGESRRRAKEVFYSKIRDRQARYGIEWRAFWAYILKVRGREGVVGVTWAPLEVENTKESWETTALKVASGVPLDVALQEAGYLFETIKEWPAVIAARAERGIQD